MGYIYYFIFTSIVWVLQLVKFLKLGRTVDYRHIWCLKQKCLNFFKEFQNKIIYKQIFYIVPKEPCKLGNRLMLDAFM